MTSPRALSGSSRKAPAPPAKLTTCVRGRPSRAGPPPAERPALKRSAATKKADSAHAGGGCAPGCSREAGVTLTPGRTDRTSRGTGRRPWWTRARCPRRAGEQNPSGSPARVSRAPAAVRGGPATPPGQRVTCSCQQTRPWTGPSAWSRQTGQRLAARGALHPGDGHCGARRRHLPRATCVPVRHVSGKQVPGGLSSVAQTRSHLGTAGR